MSRYDDDRAAFVSDLRVSIAKNTVGTYMQLQWSLVCYSQSLAPWLADCCIFD